MNYNSDYPVTNSVTYEFTTKNNTTIRYTSQDGNFDNVRAWIGDLSDGFTVHDDTDIEFWQAAVHYYLEEGISPAYNNNDLFRAAQACMYIGLVPEFDDLDRIIGFNTNHNGQPDHWDVVRVRAAVWMKENAIEAPR